MTPTSGRKREYPSLMMVFLLILSLMNGCLSDETPSDTIHPLTLIETHSLGLPEPSGLAMDVNGEFLWAVSDHNSTIYRMTRDGAIVKLVRCQDVDLEGITQHPDGTLYVVDESQGEVIHLDTVGVEIGRFRIAVEERMYLTGNLEGITYSTDNRHFYILNKKNPCRLIETDDDFNVLNRYDLNFLGDCSGIDYDSTDKSLWIVSSKNRIIFRCDMTGKPLESFSIGNIPKVEGVTVDPGNGIIYIVSDREERLYLFRK